MTKKVIIIDDNLTTLKIIKKAFSKEGWEAFCAKNAQEALNIIYNSAPDLVVTDAIMPIVGGFKLVRLIREDKIISKIPTIVYSVLDEKNAKFYIKEHFGEYFLKKSDNLDELINLANIATKSYPVSINEKLRILQRGLEKKEPEIQKPPETPQMETRIKKIDKEAFLKDFEDFKNKADLKAGFEKNIQGVFSILFRALNYDMGVVFVDENKTVYFDIRDIILSPKLKNAILQKFGAKTSVLFKKYAPNLKTFCLEEEFLTKLEAGFSPYNKKIALAFYSKEYSDIEIDETLKIIKAFFEELFDLMYSKGDIYLGVIEVLMSSSDFEEEDIINSKISRKIIDCLNSDFERVFKSEEDEYNVIIYAKEDKIALDRFNTILNSISSLDEELEVTIGVSKWNSEYNFNIEEARQEALDALSYTTQEEKVVIKNAKQL